MHKPELAREASRSAENSKDLALRIEFQDAVVPPVGHEEISVRSKHQPPRGTDVFPLVQEFSVGIEYLNPVVLPVTHINAILLVDYDGVRQVEVSRRSSLLAPGLQETSILRVFDYP